RRFRRGVSFLCSFCHVERSRDISSFFWKRIVRDPSTPLGMTESGRCRTPWNLHAKLQAIPIKGEGLVLSSLNPASQYFSHAPGLCDATAGKMWVASVKHFANATNSVVVEMLGKGFEKFPSAGLVLGMHFQPRINEGPDQPGPHCSLMVSAVTRTEVAGINRFVIGMIRGKGTQPNRSNQFFLYDLDYR